MIEQRQRKEVSPLRDNTSKRYEIAKTLTHLSIRRQAEVSQETYAVFAEDLMPYALDDIRDACKVIGARERQSGEKAFPEVGTIIAECERQAKMRRSEASRQNRCQHCCDGMVVALDDAGESHIEPCGMCGGPKWLESSIAHNRSLPTRGAA